MPLIENLEQLLQAGRDDSLLRFGLGNAYLQQQDYNNAIRHFRVAVEHDAGYSAAWKLLGKALALAQETDKAIEAFNIGIETAEAQGDKQAVREMQVFLQRLLKRKENDDK